MKNNSRFGFRFAHANMWYLTLVALATVAVTNLLKLAALVRLEIAIALALFVLLTGFITFRSRTLFGWIARRWGRRPMRERIFLYEYGGVGISWDGQRAAAYIEVLPKPYEITTISTSGAQGLRSLPIDDIRQELQQFDIRCEAVTIVNFGYKYAQPSKLATTYHHTLGPVPALLYGRTFVEVAINLSDSLESVYRRRLDDDTPAGLSRTVTLATERIRRRITRKGWTAKPLSKVEVKRLTTQLSTDLLTPLRNEHWASAGQKSMRAIAYTPTASAWTTARYRDWCRLNTHRQVQILRLDRRRMGDHAELYIGYLNGDTKPLETVSALGLRREYSQQGDILTAALPTARTDRTSAVQGMNLAGKEFPIEIHPCGAGTFVGYTKNSGEQVFVNFTVGATKRGSLNRIEFDPFYIVAPAAMCQQILLRLATSGRTIDISLPGEPWSQFAASINAGHHNSPDKEIKSAADIIVVPADKIPLPHHPGQVCIVWTTTDPKELTPAQQMNYGIVADRGESTVQAGEERARFQWTVTSTEEAYFTLRPRQATRPPQSSPEPPPGGRLATGHGLGHHHR
ncbi:type VII secretion protein EccE [Mycobacteroides chelonae]|uniref:Type VII secretion protein EccE n=1 Tax=Mycobacteroides chelonae TaxID=1774 RepID=A0A1S1LHN7_MYCCH|nr:type VII secretion protein EccE [Mycobacteroides chelonae]OHU47217.1 type VII secretion protein EccE [Mycobacteroides chelonae]